MNVTDLLFEVYILCIFDMRVYGMLYHKYHSKSIKKGLPLQELGLTFEVRKIINQYYCIVIGVVTDNNNLKDNLW